MGKAKKLKITAQKRVSSLAEDISSQNIARPTGRNKIRTNRTEDEDSKYVHEKESRKILEQARLQQQELEEQLGTASRQAPTLGQSKADSDEEEEVPESGQDEFDETFYDDLQIDAEDERALEQFMTKNSQPRQTLADIIMAKIQEKQTEIHTQFSDTGTVLLQDIDERVVKMYEQVKIVLQRYRSGKLPKAFKILPNLRNWEQILYITDPSSWSAAAMYEATKIFSSNLKEKMAQRFYNLVLLPRVRDDISEYKKLNQHLYKALRKALFKPGAFFKGILIPLCESGNCTLREAIIFGSVLAKNSIPVLHSSAALLKIAEMDYNGANSIFLRILFEKKYALPYRVIDASVYHFLRFQRETRLLPVLWHQALLTFCQRYKEDISSEQKEALLELLKRQRHHSITAEVRRELQLSKCRDTEMIFEEIV
ncbi:bystin-like [Artemia franciscana]|uniref:Bystin n=1 Tax=Artemia franciscana TaxID=6661 RepID=A0AA88I1D1_ARTSF|nr:hypothetical protein QYM36_003439 [Artemia franciscana]